MNTIALVPPNNVIAVVAFLVVIVLSVRDRDWKTGLLATGLAALSWPW